MNGMQQKANKTFSHSGISSSRQLVLNIIAPEDNFDKAENNL
jgi:hypothetical protein